MRILYVNYWGAAEGLSVSTVNPCLLELAGYDYVEHIDYFSIERAPAKPDAKSPIQSPKITHRPLQSKNIGFNVLSRALDTLRFYWTLSLFVLSNRVDVVVCRSSMGGIFGVFLNLFFGKQFIVEYYEPHADYMADSGVWSPGGLKYGFQKWAENWMLKKARALMPVSMNYQQKLINAGADKEKIAVFPCTVDTAQFAFSPEKRAEFRRKIGVKNETVGIYVGKFGGIYYDEEAFAIFKQGYEHFKGAFHLVLLTPTPKNEVESKLKAVGFPLEKATITLSPHDQVPHYLSAADFAFSTIRPCESRKFCSPIKDGEYWANGLPILLPPDVGDDSQIILSEKRGGAIFNLDQPDSIETAFETIDHLLAANDRDATVELAVRYRSFDFIRQAYARFLKPMGK